MGNGVQMLAFSMAWWKFCLTWFDVTAGAQGFQGFLSATASDWIPISQINPTFIQSPDQLKFSWNLSRHGFPLNRWQIPGSFEGGGRFGSGLNCRTETDLCKVSTVQSLYAGAICIKIIEIHIWVSWTKGGCFRQGSAAEKCECCIFCSHHIQRLQLFTKSSRIRNIFKETNQRTLKYHEMAKKLPQGHNSIFWGIHPGPSTLLYYISQVIWVSKYRWST